MATQDHNDLLRAGQCPGAPFSLTDTLENRPQSPATQHTARHIEHLVHHSSPRGLAHLITIKLSQTSFRNVDRSRAEGINRGYTPVYTCVHVCIVCADADQLRLLPVPYILESIKRIFQPLDIALTAHNRHSRFDEEMLRWYSRFRGLNIKWREARWKLLGWMWTCFLRIGEIGVQCNRDVTLLHVRMRVRERCGYIEMKYCEECFVNCSSIIVLLLWNWRSIFYCFL